MPEVVDAVAELVEHRVHRVVRRHDVRQDPDVAGAVDVDAERMLVLAVARVQVASLDDPVDLEPDTRHRATRQPDDVLALEERVEIDGPVRRRLLEERIRVVPRAQVSRRAAEPRGESLVERAFPAPERHGRDAIGLGERLRELALVELVRRQREREPVAVAEAARGLVAQARELADIVGNDRADGLGRLPGLAALGRIVALAKDALDLGVADLRTGDHTAMA